MENPASRQERLNLRLFPREWELVRKAAALKGQVPGVFARDLLVRAAKAEVATIEPRRRS